MSLPNTLSPAPLPFVATITNVREVSLYGSADLNFWRRAIQHEDLEPFPVDGRAQFLISSIQAKFMGLTFRELVFSLLVREPQTDSPIPAAYLTQAFHSLRAFAWIERTLFKTPYVFAKLQVDIEPTPRIRLGSGAAELFAAISTRDNAARTSPEELEEQSWTGPIYIPSRADQPPAARKLFYAHLGGKTACYPFDSQRDQLALNPDARWPILGQLKDSNFTGTMWQIRTNATHARSKTAPRMAQ